MTPDLFDASVHDGNEANGVVLHQILRGLADNGMLANLHKDGLVKHIHKDRIPSLSPALRDKVLTCLNHLDDRHRLVRHPKRIDGDPASDLDWLQLALGSHQTIPFHAIVSSRDLMDQCDEQCPAFVDFPVCLDSQQWDSRRRTLTLSKTDADYRSALSCILRHAKTASLVDPYLNCQESRYMDTVALCAETMGQRVNERLKGRIHVHAEMKHQKPYGKTEKEYLDGWEAKLKPIVAKEGHRFKIHLWESLPGSESMHDRYLLTDQCGVIVPGGLDCRTHTHANKTTWSLMDDEDRRAALQDYDPVTGLFKLLGERVVI